MRNGCDAIVVPHGRQNREEQPRQTASPSVRHQAVELRYSGHAEISDGQASGTVRRQHDVKAAVPKNTLSWCKPGRWRRADELAHHEDALTPTDEATPPERMSVTRSGAEQVAQSSDPRPPSRIEGAANRGGYGRQHPLRHLVRHRQKDTGVEEGEPGGMQFRGPG